MSRRSIPMLFFSMFLLILSMVAVQAETTRILFGSCSDQRKPQPIWKPILEMKPAYYLFLGDNVYGDSRTPKLEKLKRAYAKFAQNKDVRRLRAQSHTLATWDDHDFGFNNAGGDFPWKRKSQKMFLDFWEVPETDARRKRDGIYYSEIHGAPGKRIQFIMLDTRFFRSALLGDGSPKPKYRADKNPEKTMLGAAQWGWLETQLRKAADIRFIVSSVQIIARGHRREGWRNLPRERKRLFNLIGETEAQGVIFLSGDRHLGAVYRDDAKVPYPLYELTSSALNRPSKRKREQGPKQLGSAFTPVNFGSIDIDWARRTVLLALRDVDGMIVRRQKIDLSVLAR